MLDRGKESTVFITGDHILTVVVKLSLLPDCLGRDPDDNLTVDPGNGLIKRNAKNLARITIGCLRKFSEMSISPETGETECYCSAAGCRQLLKCWVHGHSTATAGLALPAVGRELKGRSTITGVAHKLEESVG